MSHDIPTVPQDDPAETIMAALAHGLTGHPEKAAPLFEPFILGGRPTALGLSAALANVAIRRQGLPVDGVDGMVGLFVFNAETGKRGSSDNLPAGVRFAAQFTAAWANHQRDTAAALFDALITSGTEEAASALADGIHALFDMAVASLTKSRSR